MASSRGLGKGLSALISENYVKPAVAEKTAAVNATANSSNLVTLPLAKLIPGQYQPRSQFDEETLSDLAASIQRNGIMQPIIVRTEVKGKYEIVAGERRWRAAKIAGLDEVPVIVRSITDQQALELALVENIQRQDLTALEEATGYQRLIDEFGYTQEKLASTIGKGRSHVANMLRLLGLPEEVKEMLEKGELTAGRARALLNAPDPVALARDIVRKNLNVRAVEEVARIAKGQEKRSAPRPNRGGGTWHPPVNKDPDILALEESLSENLGLKVSINDRGQSGEIVLSYDSLTQLDEILRRLGDGI